MVLLRTGLFLVMAILILSGVAAGAAPERVTFFVA